MNTKENVKYFLIGFCVTLVVLIGWKVLLVLGLCGVVFLMFTASFMDWSGDGDGRQWPSNHNR